MPHLNPHILPLKHLPMILIITATIPQNIFDFAALRISSSSSSALARCPRCVYCCGLDLMGPRWFCNKKKLRHVLKEVFVLRNIGGNCFLSVHKRNLTINCNSGYPGKKGIQECAVIENTSQIHPTSNYLPTPHHQI